MAINMKILDNEKQCVGCGLCAWVCDKNAITMRAAEGGFLYPQIDAEKCVSCQKCRSFCPVVKERKKVEPQECYALNDNRDERRRKSASGGAATLFFEETIGRGGMVCGCRLDENLQAVHDTADSIESIDLFRDSKYVQSDMSAAWGKISSSLSNGKELLVCGTPCQMAAVNSRFGKNDNLTTVDFVFSGVPDPQIFEIYKADIEKESGKKIKEFYFRDKTNGWKKSNIKVVFTDGTQQIITRKDSYYFKLFGGNLYFRECCYNCRFKKFNTYADITVGDYWGIEKIHPELDDDSGCSLVIVNTDKGKALADSVKGRCKVASTPLDFAVQTHPKLEKSINRAKYRDLFFHIYKGDEKSLKKAMKLCMGGSVVRKIKRVLYSKALSAIGKI